jgi:hypothetical protein
MKTLKKINPTSLVNAVFVVLLAGIVVFAVETYRNQARYTAQKKEPGKAAATGNPAARSVGDPRPSSGFRDFMMYDLFEKGVKSKRTTDAQEEVQGSNRFTILGVVKMERLFLVVELPGVKQPRLFAEKSKFNNDFLVEEIGKDRVLIRDGSGRIRTHKIFHYEEVEKSVEKNVIKLFQSRPAGSRPAAPKQRKRRGVANNEQQ